MKKLERDARLRQRLAAVGEMAAGIAHEIRNPLASMSGSIQVLRQELPLSAEQAQLMDIVLRESERLNDTIRSFLAYARPQRFQIARLDIRRVLRDTALLLRNSAEVGRSTSSTSMCPAGSSFTRPTRTKFVRSCGTSPPTACVRCVRGAASGSRHASNRPQEVDSETRLCLKSRMRASGLPPKSSTGCFNRFTGLSAREAGWDWRLCTASSATTTERLS